MTAHERNRAILLPRRKNRRVAAVPRAPDPVRARRHVEDVPRRVARIEDRGKGVDKVAVPARENSIRWAGRTDARLEPQHRGPRRRSCARVRRPEDAAGHAEGGSRSGLARLHVASADVDDVRVRRVDAVVEHPPDVRRRLGLARLRRQSLPLRRAGREEPEPRLGDKRGVLGLLARDPAVEVTVRGPVEPKRVAVIQWQVIRAVIPRRVYARTRRRCGDGRGVVVRPDARVEHAGPETLRPLIELDGRYRVGRRAAEGRSGQCAGDVDPRRAEVIAACDPAAIPQPEPVLVGDVVLVGAGGEDATCLTAIGRHLVHGVVGPRRLRRLSIPGRAVPPGLTSVRAAGESDVGVAEVVIRRRARIDVVVPRGRDLEPVRPPRLAFCPRPGRLGIPRLPCRRRSQRVLRQIERVLVREQRHVEVGRRRSEAAAVL